MAPPALALSLVKVGFLGAGRMARALCAGLVSAGLVKPSNIFASDLDRRTLQILEKNSGVQVRQRNREVLEESDVVILATKPDGLTGLIQDIGPCIRSSHLLVSIAAGVTIDILEQTLPRGTRLIRVMPNTPALVQAGATVYSPGTHARPADGQLVQQLFSAVGSCQQLAEKHMDAVTALSGSGPAYVFVAIEALADGGVKMGLPRDMALSLAAQTVMGAAKMVLESGTHPAMLKDAVCSPMGTTIAGVHSLEKSGFRSALMNAVEAASNRSHEMGEQAIQERLDKEEEAAEAKAAERNAERNRR